MNGAELKHRLGLTSDLPESASRPPRLYDGPQVTLTTASSLRPEPVTWLWPGWLAAGKLHILGGAPGAGKTTLALAMAAVVSTGGRWPDGTQSPCRHVVVWSGEDDPSDTLTPRLVASGANLSHIHFVGDVHDSYGRRGFDPARDMAALADRLVDIGDIGLLIVDPIVSAVSGDSHKNAEVRRGLQPLVDLAGKLGCALLGITHFSKGTGGRDPTERITGSLAFGALARLVMVAAKHQDEGSEARRVLLRAKSNIGIDGGGFEYSLQEQPLSAFPGVFATRAIFGASIEGAARDILAEADATDEDSNSLADCKQFLRDLLADGPVSVKQIKADIDGAGYSWATARRAQKALAIEAIKEGLRSVWVWRLPASGPEGAQENPKVLNKKTWASSGNDEHLRPDQPDIEVEFF